MTPALRPETALAWLRSMSTDLEAAVVLDARGRVLAGDAALGARVAAGDRALLLARSARHVVAVQPGRGAFRRLLELDVGTALAALERP
jgi:hypothetical protein